MAGRHPSTWGPDASTPRVLSFGPEPIGASIAEALDTLNGAQLAGFTAPTPAGWGLQGSLERDNESVFAPVQVFPGAVPANGTPVQFPEPALPNTYIPAGLEPYGVAGPGLVTPYPG